jgi:hypothetical protein
MIAASREGASRLNDILLCNESAAEGFKQALRDAFRPPANVDYDDVVRAAEDRLLSTSAPKNSSDGNDVDPVESGAARMAENAATENNVSEGWQIKTHKYAKGLSWSATNGTMNLNSKPGVLFATEDEARADARAAIEREQGPTKEVAA